MILIFLAGEVTPFLVISEHRGTPIQAPVYDHPCDRCSRKVPRIFRSRYFLVVGNPKPILFGELALPGKSSYPQ